MKNSTPTPHKNGFTLIELIVTMAILSIILVVALQLTDSAKRTLTISENRSENDAVARKFFDQFGRDLEQIVLREDMPAEFQSLVGNDELKVVVNQPGVLAGGVGNRDVSVLSYRIVDTVADGLQLQRGTQGFDFTDILPIKPIGGTVALPAIPIANEQIISKNIFRMEIDYFVDSGAGVTRVLNPPANVEDLKGLIVTIATIDDGSLKLIRNQSRDLLLDLADTDNFGDSAPPTIGAAGDTASTQIAWNDAIAAGVSPTGATADANLLAEAMKSVRIYERVFLVK